MSETLFVDSVRAAEGFERFSSGDGVELYGFDLLLRSSRCRFSQGGGSTIGVSVPSGGSTICFSLATSICSFRAPRGASPDDELERCIEDTVGGGR